MHCSLSYAERAEYGMDLLRRFRSSNGTGKSLSITEFPSPSEETCQYALPVGYQQHHLDPAKHADTMDAFRFYLEQQHQPQKNYCSTCAVVGGAGSLLYGEAFGQEIDQHECILRANDQPLAGYEDRVGSRTDLQFVYESLPPPLQFDSPDRSRHAAMNVVYLSFWAHDVLHLRELLKKEPEKWKHVVMMNPAIGLLTRRLQTLSVRHLESIKRPTTGSMMLTYAALSCGNVSIYGFDPTAIPFHYYTVQDIAR
eukprot:scaffold1561_cov404-Prasinococcus_capsulatus_cf.AAC.5